VVAASDENTARNVLILAILAAIVAGLIAAFLGYRRRGKTEDAWDDELAGLAGQCRWVADSLALNVMNRTTPPLEVEGIWRDGRTRMVDLEQQLASMSGTAPDEERATRAATIRDNLAALREALDNDVRLRRAGVTAESTAAGQETLLEDSARVVSDRRRALQRAIEPEPANPA
jgi:hypothetical protein